MCLWVFHLRLRHDLYIKQFHLHSYHNTSVVLTHACTLDRGVVVYITYHLIVSAEIVLEY